MLCHSRFPDDLAVAHLKGRERRLQNLPPAATRSLRHCCNPACKSNTHPAPREKEHESLERLTAHKKTQARRVDGGRRFAARPTVIALLVAAWALVAGPSTHPASISPNPKSGVGSLCRAPRSPTRPTRLTCNPKTDQGPVYRRNQSQDFQISRT